MVHGYDMEWTERLTTFCDQQLALLEEERKEDIRTVEDALNDRVLNNDILPDFCRRHRAPHPPK